MIFKNNMITNLYTIVRIQKRSEKRRIKELTHDNEYKLLIKIDICTNAIRFCNSIKECFNNNVIEFNGTDFTVIDDSITEVDLRIKIYSLYNKRIINT